MIQQQCACGRGPVEADSNCCAACRSEQEQRAGEEWLDRELARLARDAEREGGYA